MKEVTIPTEKLPVTAEADICVIGGGCTGVFAAIRAARLGASVVILEKQNRFGGCATSGLVCMWHSLFDITREKQIIGGLTLETLERLGKRNAASSYRTKQPGISFNSEELTLELDALVLEQKRIRTFFHTFFSRPILDEDGRITGVVAENKSGRFVVSARAFVDASGDGLLCRAAGVPMYRPKTPQPPTACAHIENFRKMKDLPEQKLRVVPPLLRKEVLETTPVKGDYIHGYMLNSGFADDVISWHKKHPEVKLKFFWDKDTDKAVTAIDDTLSFHTLDDAEFLRQMAGCKAYASTAGFESICEAMYLEKPVLMVPSHIEQECNAFDAMKSGAGISADRFDLGLLLEFTKGFRPDHEFREWVKSSESIIINELEKYYKDSDILVNKIKRKFEK